MENKMYEITTSVYIEPILVEATNIIEAIAIAVAIRRVPGLSISKIQIKEV